GFMVATLLLVGCALTPGQSAERADWLLAPRLSRSQEFAYSGTFAEESSGGGVLFNRSFRVEWRFLVLDAGAKNSEVALFTVLKARESVGAKTAPKLDSVPNSVRLELVKVDARGKVTWGNNGTISLPLDGPPTLEWGAFIELPHRRVGVNQTWEAAEEG